MFPLLYGSSGGGSGNLYCKLSGDWNMVSESCWKRLILKYKPWGISDPEGPETSGWCWRPRPGPGQCTAGGSCDGEPARRPWAEWRSSPYFCTHPVIFKGEVLDQCEEAGSIFSLIWQHTEDVAWFWNSYLLWSFLSWFWRRFASSTFFCNSSICSSFRFRQFWAATLFFPRLRMSRQMLSCSSVISSLLNISLNSSMGGFTISSCYKKTHVSIKPST